MQPFEHEFHRRSYGCRTPRRVQSGDSAIQPGRTLGNSRVFGRRYVGPGFDDQAAVELLDDVSQLAFAEVLAKYSDDGGLHDLVDYLLLAHLAE